MEQIGSYLQEAHLQVIRQEYIIFFPPSFRRLRIVERSLGWCALGAQYVVVSEKIENPAA
jgi:hypothetical protein